MGQINEILSHIPKGINKSIEGYVSEVVLRRSRYMFVRREKKVQHGFCTHCRTENTYGGLKHNDEVECVGCQSLCVTKSSGRGRKYLMDEAYFIWFDKSLKDPKAISARGILVQRDYSGDYTQVESTYRDTAAYVFEEGDARMATRSYWGGRSYGDQWELRKSIFDERDGAMSFRAGFLSLESIKDAVPGTRFQYCVWDRYDGHYLLAYFGLAAKYPCVEYLTKFGLKNFVDVKLSGGRTFGTINWRGETLDKVMRVSKHELKEIRDADFQITPFSMWIYHEAQKDGSGFTIKEANSFVWLCGDRHNHEIINEVRGFANLRQIRNYINKQLKKGSPAHYRSGDSVLRAWRDQMVAAEKLGMDLSDESTIFPNNLYETHQASIERIKVIADEALNQKIRKQLPKLNKLGLEVDGLFLRPAVDSAELIAEGNALKHCVGSYAARYAKGETALFVIRKADEPEIPFYTLEVKDGRVAQVYGFKNCHPTKEVEKFVERFKQIRLKIEQEDVAV